MDNQKSQRPAIVTVGFTYYLVKENGDIKPFAGTLKRFPELKSVSHMGPFMFAIGDKHWKDPADASWKTDLTKTRETVARALTSVDKLDWRNPAWPGGEDKLRDFIRSGLETVDKFASDTLAKGDYTREDYGRFAKEYTPYMVATFYLSSLGSTYETLEVLKSWKKELGDDAWKRLQVVIGGSQGRTTAGLTPETNPIAQTIGSLMEPADFHKNVVMAPGANSVDEALQLLGNAVTAKTLGDATFTTDQSKHESGFYEALQTSDIPLALYDTKQILKELKNGTAKDPVLGLGPGPSGTK